jgi:hypothetical protein
MICLIWNQKKMSRLRRRPGHEACKAKAETALQRPGAKTRALFQLKTDRRRVQ